MNNYLSFLISLVYDGRLVKVALKINRNLLSDDCSLYWAEPENRTRFRSFLPLHFQDHGAIVAIDEISDVVIVSES